jgi:hypothetical protein
LLKEKIFLMVLLYILIGLFFSFQNFFFFYFLSFLHLFTCVYIVCATSPTLTPSFS